MASGAVTLRDVIESDLPIFYEQQLDPDAARMAAFPSRDREAFMAHWAKIMRMDTVTLKTILFGAEVAGNIVAFEQDEKPHIGYWIGKPYWGKGIATEALAQFLRVVTERPLYAYVVKHNVGSLRVLQKCGFTIIGEDMYEPDESGEIVEEYVLELSE
jgi:RimJ/RimL family protein N-acetyltransferase